MRKLKLSELGRVDVSTYKQQPKHAIVVLLDNIRSGMNVGAFFRTCDAFAISHLILAGITPSPPHKEIQRSAIGATNSVDFTVVENAEAVIREYKEAGFRIVGVEQTDSSLHLSHFQWPNESTMIVFGNEVEGVNQNLLQHCDHVIDIQQFGTKHSLNVAVCAGVVLWNAIQNKKRC